MFKKMPVCRLMISCPSDVKTEIEIINRVVDNINDSIGWSLCSSLLIQRTQEREE